MMNIEAITHDIPINLYIVTSSSKTIVPMTAATTVSTDAMTGTLEVAGFFESPSCKAYMPLP